MGRAEHCPTPCVLASGAERRGWFYQRSEASGPKRVTLRDAPRRPLLARSLRAELRYAWGLRRLPGRVAWFLLRARWVARRSGDAFSLVSPLSARKLAVLLELAEGRRRVVELGTGTAWTAIALALADGRRDVLSYDPVERPERERYLALVPPATRRRIELVTAPGADGPCDPRPVDLLFVDSAHEREPTLAEFAAWRPALDAGALVVFDDYANPDYPGIAEAIGELGLDGEERETLFVWRAGATAP